MISNFKRWRAVAVSLLVVSGFAVWWAWCVLGPSAMDTRNLRWVWGDLAQVYVAWGQYLSDPDAGWLTTSRMSTPLVSSVSLFDSMPLFLLLVKPFAALIAPGQQFFGWYFAGCLVLQGAFGYLAARQAMLLTRVDDWLGHYVAVLCGILFLSIPFTFLRFQGHTALASQWVLALSIWATLASLDKPLRRWMLANGSVLLLATGINPYLAFLVALSIFVISTSNMRRYSYGELLIRVSFLVFVAGFGLFLFGFMGASTAEGGGYGHYSMNMLGPLDSNGMAGLFRLDFVDATSGQSFEGFNYVGLGVLLLILLVVVSFINWSAGATDFPYLGAVAVVLCCYILAISTTITFSEHTFNIKLPDGVHFLLSRFRSSGRLFWIGGFWLVILATSALVLRFGLPRSAVLLTAFVVVQLIDVYPIAVNVRKSIDNASSVGLDGVNATDPSQILVFPAWQCDHQETPGGIRNYEAVGYYALLHRIPTNNFYAARTTDEQRAFHCDIDERLRTIDPQTVYLLSPKIYAKHKTSFDGHHCNEIPGLVGQPISPFWACVPQGRR